MGALSSMHSLTSVGNVVLPSLSFQPSGIVPQQANTIRTHWDDVCDKARVPTADRGILYGRQFLNPFAFYDAPEEIKSYGGHGTGELR